MIVIENYSKTKIYITNLWVDWYLPKFNISMEVNGDILDIYWFIGQEGTDVQHLPINYNDVGGYGYINPTSATDLMNTIQAYIDSAWTDIGPGGEILTAKADLLSNNGTTDEILPGGANESYLQRDNVEATGLKWVPVTTILSATNVGAAISGASGATPNDSDYVATSDSGTLKRITWSGIKTFLKSYFDGFYKTTISKSSSDQTTTSTSLVDITNVGIAIAANENMYVKVFLKVGCSATNGARWAVTIPTGCTMFLSHAGTSEATRALAAPQWLTTSGTEGATTNAIINTSMWVVMEGWVYNGANAGTIQVQGRSINAANTVTIYSGSMIKGEVI